MNNINHSNHLQNTRIIVVPVFGTRISSRLDCADNLMLFTISGFTIKDREKIRLVSYNELDKIQVITSVKPDIIICDGITDLYKNQLEERKIKVIPWIRGEVEEVLIQYLKGKLNHE